MTYVLTAPLTTRELLERVVPSPEGVKELKPISHKDREGQRHKGLLVYRGIEYASIAALHQGAGGLKLALPTLRARLKAGMSVEEAIEVPVRFQRSYTVAGTTYESLADLAEAAGVNAPSTKRLTAL
jgi:hypothetical protein